MARVAPATMGLASKEVVCRDLTVEIREGRGVGPYVAHILLHLDHLPLETLTERLPGNSETAKISAGMDVANEPAPIVAGCLPQHWWPSYQMQDAGRAQGRKHDRSGIVCCQVRIYIYIYIYIFLLTALLSMAPIVLGPTLCSTSWF